MSLEENKDNSPIIIVYHDGCLDGMASAWVMARALRIKDGAKNKNIKYIAYEHSEISKAQDIIRASINRYTRVYFVDVAPEVDFLDELLAADKNGIAKLKEIDILDHHATSAKRLKGHSFKESHETGLKLNINIDDSKNSATAMIWAIMFPDETMPAVIEHIDKMDISTNLETSEDFAAAAYIDERSLGSISEAFKSLRFLETLSFKEMAKRGSSIKDIQEKKIEKFLKNKKYVTLQILPDTEPLDIPIVQGRVRDFGRLISGHLVALGKDSGVNITFSWFERAEGGSVTMSIRSNGNPDLTKVTQYLCSSLGIKGGGHKNSAAVHFSSIKEFKKHIIIKDSIRNKKTLPVKASIKNKL